MRLWHLDRSKKRRAQLATISLVAMPPATEQREHPVLSQSQPVIGYSANRQFADVHWGSKSCASLSPMALVSISGTSRLARAFVAHIIICTNAVHAQSLRGA
jgi:hypothetical protein